MSISICNVIFVSRLHLPRARALSRAPSSMHTINSNANWFHLNERIVCTRLLARKPYCWWAGEHAFRSTKFISIDWILLMANWWGESIQSNGAAVDETRRDTHTAPVPVPVYAVRTNFFGSRDHARRAMHNCVTHTTYLFHSQRDQLLPILLLLLPVFIYFLLFALLVISRNVHKLQKLNGVHRTTDTYPSAHLTLHRIMKKKKQQRKMGDKTCEQLFAKQATPTSKLIIMIIII